MNKIFWKCSLHIVGHCVPASMCKDTGSGKQNVNNSSELFKMLNSVPDLTELRKAMTDSWCIIPKVMGNRDPVWENKTLVF